MNKEDNYTFETLKKENLQHLRNLNNIMLPITYSDFAYKKILKEGKNFSFVGRFVIFFFKKFF